MATQLTRIETLLRLTEALEFQDEQLTEHILTELIGEDAALKNIAAMLAAVMKAQADQTALLKQIEQELNAQAPDSGPLRLTIAVPILLNKQGVQTMPGTVNF